MDSQRASDGQTIPDEDGRKVQLNSNWSKLQLLMWKNWLLQIRHPRQLILQLFGPVLISVVLVLIRLLVSPQYINNETHFPIMPLSSNLKPLLTNMGTQALSLFYVQRLSDTNINLDLRFAFAPNTSNRAREIVTKASNSLEIGEPVGYATAIDAEDSMKSETYICVLDLTHTVWPGHDKMPKKLNYSIRMPSELRTEIGDPKIYNWHTNKMFPNEALPGPRDENKTAGGSPSYYNEGFLAIQNAIAGAFVQTHRPDKEMPEIAVQRFPYPPYIKDPMLISLVDMMGFIIMLSFINPCTNTVRFLTTEKEMQLKEAMKIMGLPNWLHWTGWLLRSFLMISVPVTLMVTLFCIRFREGLAVFTNTSWLALLLFMLIYGVATIFFCFMLSVFFANANTAATVTGLVFFVQYMLYTFVVGNYDQMPFATKLLLSLNCNVAMPFGFKLITHWENIGFGLQMNNFFSPTSVDDNLSVGDLCITMLLSSVLCMLVALYVERVFPGKNGVPDKWYFPFTREFWTGTHEYKALRSEPSSTDKNVRDKRRFETEPVHLPAGVRILGLHKTFGEDFTAVHPMHMNMYDGQITVLLGHNGAGKSTTMGMLTGLLQPTSGTALINGYDLRKEMGKARQSIGLCPQHNILFNELTVEEHLVFYCTLKGMPVEEIPDEVDKYLRLIDLEPKRKAQSHSLSGGMKRKLSVCVAFCAGSQVVLCDEPTSGLDPAARRALWNVIQHETQGRSVLLSTHFMDEADVLGDRIAIMSNGQIQCCGSSFFLKRQFGPGYRLVCAKTADCKSSSVTELLRRHCPEVQVETDIGTELSYQLSDEWVDKFAPMFEEFEMQMQTMGVSGFGLSLTTMEEVFMAVGTDDDAKKTTVRSTDLPAVSNQEFSLEIGKVQTGTSLFMCQASALLHKKVLQSIRSWRMLIVQLLIPIVMLTLTILSNDTDHDYNELPALRIRAAMFPESEAILDMNTNSAQHLEILDGYRDSFRTRFIKEYAVSHKLSITQSTINITQYIFEAYAADKPRTDRSMLIGCSVGMFNQKPILVAWYNNQPYHTAPISLRLVHDAVIRAYLGPDYLINVMNQPLPFSAASRQDMVKSPLLPKSEIGMNLTFAMSFVAAMYVLPYIRERISGSMHLQMVSGARVYTYWLTSFVWDIFTFVFTVVAILLVPIILRTEGWSSAGHICHVLVVMTAFGCSFLPMTYVLSRRYKDTSTGFTNLMFLFMFCGVILYLIVFILRLPDFNTQHIAKTLSELFHVFPHFGLCQALQNLNSIEQRKLLCASWCAMLPICVPDQMCKVVSECCEANIYGMQETGIGYSLLFFAIICFIGFAMLMLLEYRQIDNVCYRLKSCWASFRTAVKTAPENTSTVIVVSGARDPDSDVVAEQNRVAAMSTSEIAEQNLVVRRMTKDYGEFRAVNELSLCAQSAECFGLLGINGAGKTSTFGMLTGAIPITDGDAWVRGVSLRSNMTRVHRSIGYCPQFDGLVNEMTGREVLHMFCALRGIAGKNDVQRLTQVLAQELHFERYLDRAVGKYSGGNKRKVSTAIALIGNPMIVYLDEPTTGMDPNAKRCLWNVVTKVRTMGKTVVLTSHSMDECEALCTRVAIMVAGEFRCLGGLQHLKSKFATGYTLFVKLKKVDDPPGVELTKQPLRAYIQQTLPGATLTHEFQEQMSYAVATDGVEGQPLRWSQIFTIMERAKQQFPIEDYAISQTTLEMVFLSFAQQQIEDS